MNARPTAGRLIVRPLKEAKQTPGGIFLPEQTLQTLDRGEVLEVGNSVFACKKGDTVIYSKYGGQSVTVDKDVLMVLKEEDVLLVLDEEEN